MGDIHVHGWCAALSGNGRKGGWVGECCPLPPASPPAINETLTIDTTCVLPNGIIYDIGSLDFFLVNYGYKNLFY